MAAASNFKFSITIQTRDRAVMFSLRALAVMAQCYNSVAGTTEANWIQNDHSIVLRFTALKYRDVFIKESRRLFPDEFIWRIRGLNDDDPIAADAKQEKS